MNDVRSAVRPSDPQRVEPRILTITGALLLGLAALFTWQELRMQTEALAVALAVVVAAAGFTLARLKVQVLGPVLVLGATVAAGLWYAATREPMLIAALSIAFVSSIALVALERKRARVDEGIDRWHRLISWQAIGISGLVTSFSFYFHIFDASDLSLQQYLVRRVVLTLAWLLSGTGLVLIGRAAKKPEVRDAGFLVLATSVLKLLTYDLTHVDGLTRIAALAIGGLTLVGAAQLARRLNQSSASS